MKIPTFSLGTPSILAGRYPLLLPPDAADGAGGAPASGGAADGGASPPAENAADLKKKVEAKVYRKFPGIKQGD